MPIKFLLLGGGGSGLFWKGGGGSANFIFMGVGIFPNLSCANAQPFLRNEMDPFQAILVSFGPATWALFRHFKFSQIQVIWRYEGVKPKKH